VQLLTSLKSRMKRAPRRRILSMGTLRGHTTLSQARTKLRSFRASMMRIWGTFSAGLSRSKNTNGHRQQPFRLRDSIRGPSFLAMLMFLIKLIVTVILGVISD